MMAYKVWVVDNQYGYRELGTITKLYWLVVTLRCLLWWRRPAPCCE